MRHVVIHCIEEQIECNVFSLIVAYGKKTSCIDISLYTCYTWAHIVFNFNTQTGSTFHQQEPLNLVIDNPLIHVSKLPPPFL